MKSFTLHDHPPAPSILPLHGPTVPTATSRARLRDGLKAAGDTIKRPVGSATATSPETSASARDATGSPSASQREFYQYFGLALLALIAISILIAAGG